MSASVYASLFSLMSGTAMKYHEKTSSIVIAVVYPAQDFGRPLPHPSTETRTKGATAIVVDEGRRDAC